MFAEPYARLLLVVHTLLAAALVATSTHLVLWMRGYLRGQCTRHRATQRFAMLSFLLYLATFLVGNLIYPIYKVHVRVQYFEDPEALAADYRARREARQRTQPQQKVALPPFGETHIPQEMSIISRWFDVKEHWMAVGLALSCTCFLILRWWIPSRHGTIIAPLVFAFALGQAATTWFGALVGIIASSYRSVGSIG